MKKKAFRTGLYLADKLVGGACFLNGSGEDKLEYRDFRGTDNPRPNRP